MGQVIVIAEAGVNHNGSVKMAYELVDAAAEAGADIVKFQTAKLGSLVSRYAPMAEYQECNLGEKKSQKEMLADILLSYEDFILLEKYCRKRNILFLSTPFDVESVRFLEPLVPFWKIPSGEITNFPYLVEVARTKKKVVLSTGMCTISEIENACDVLREYGTTEISLLHCTTEYPAPMMSVNLRAMKTLENRFGVPCGYSDHTLGDEVALASVALGAKIIEKHITIDKNLPGPDHKASMEPDKFREMVTKIRNLEMALGDGIKAPTTSELKNRDVVRKSIVAARNIMKGECFSSDNITTKRPGNGISPMLWERVIGMRANRDYLEDELIQMDALIN